MKKTILLLAFVSLLSGLVYSQDIRNTFGLRLGYDAQEISYQLPLVRTFRLELTLGANTYGHNQVGKLCRGVGLNGLFQWVNDLSFLSTGFKWYIGVGANVLDHGSVSKGMYGTGAMAQIGVEYNFNSPWQLSLDYRPGWYWLPGAGNVYRTSWNAPCVSLRHML